MHLEVHHAPNLPEKLVNISRIRDERIGSGLVGGSGIENPAHHNDRGSLSRLLSSHPLKEFGGFIILRAVVFCIAVISSQRRFVSCQFNQSSGRSAAIAIQDLNASADLKQYSVAIGRRTLELQPRTQQPWLPSASQGRLLVAPAKWQASAACGAHGG